MSEQLNSVKRQKWIFGRIVNWNNFLSMIALTIILFAYFRRLPDSG
jgi:hypothetical protein